MSPLWLIPVGILAFGAVFFAIGWIRGRTTHGWVRTTGIVVNRSGGTSGLPAYYPTFQWTDQHGQVHQHTSGLGASLQPRPGRTVPVKYDPAAPDRAIMDTFSQSGRVFYLVAGIIWLVGIPFSLMIVLAVTTMSSGPGGPTPAP